MWHICGILTKVGRIQFSCRSVIYYWEKLFFSWSSFRKVDITVKVIKIRSVKCVKKGIQNCNCVSKRKHSVFFSECTIYSISVINLYFYIRELIRGRSRQKGKVDIHENPNKTEHCTHTYIQFISFTFELLHIYLIP